MYVGIVIGVCPVVHVCSVVLEASSSSLSNPLTSLPGLPSLSPHPLPLPTSECPYIDHATSCNLHAARKQQAKLTPKRIPQPRSFWANSEEFYWLYTYGRGQTQDVGREEAVCVITPPSKRDFKVVLVTYSQGIARDSMGDRLLESMLRFGKGSIDEMWWYQRNSMDPNCA